MKKQQLPLEYNYQGPEINTGKAPVIILLHGYGSDHNDLFSFATYLPKTHHIIALKAPLAIPGQGNAWYSIYFVSLLQRHAFNSCDYMSCITFVVVVLFASLSLEV